MFDWVKSLIARRTARQPRAFDAAVRQLLARYDAAQTNSENSKHWANADSLSASAANSPGVRRLLRNRARYECANNCYANGMVRTLAYHCVGPGPILQVSGPDQVAAKRIEKGWRQWSRAANLAEKLRVLREARAKDGEAFAILTTNPLLASPVKLSLRCVEAEQFAAAGVSGTSMEPNNVDGIRFDQWGNPQSYELLDAHPGDALALGMLSSRQLRARDVFHAFREERPGQRRGIPEITPALPLYAILRRYTLATLSSSEIAAMLAVFLKTTGPAVSPVDGEALEWSEIPLNRGTMTVLPEGWSTEQFDAKQPLTQYDAFVRSIIREIARCLDMPFNVAAGDSSSYNYSSGRLDHQTYARAIDVDRDWFSINVLDRLFGEWLAEASLQPQIFGELGSVADLEISWHWEPFLHVDPLKESNAASNDMSHGLASLPTYYAEQGLDWQVELAKQAESLGMSLEDYQRRLADKLLGPQGEQIQQNSASVAAALRSLKQQVEELASAA